eukprot:359750-Chlamydomonas_euryale.AAC.2
MTGIARGPAQHPPANMTLRSGSVDKHVDTKSVSCAASQSRGRRKVLRKCMQPARACFGSGSKDSCAPGTPGASHFGSDSCALGMPGASPCAACKSPPVPPSHLSRGLQIPVSASHAPFQRPAGPRQCLPCTFPEACRPPSVPLNAGTA